MTHTDPANSSPAVPMPMPAALKSAGSLTPRASWVRSLRDLAVDLWEYRDLLRELVLRDVRLRYKQAVMGLAWAVLMPMLIVSAGIVVRFAMSRYSGGSFGGVDVAAVAVRGLAWAFVVGALSFATGSVASNAVLVGKVYFPRAILPISAVLAQFIDFIVGCVAVAIVLFALGVHASAALIWVPLLVAMLLAFTLATALVLSCANLFFRDVKYLVQVALTFGIFFTPVLLDPVHFGNRGAAVMMLNPIAPILEGLRLAVVDGHNLLRPLVATTAHGELVRVWAPWTLGYAGVWSLVSIVAGSLVFRHFEFDFAENV